MLTLRRIPYDRTIHRLLPNEGPLALRQLWKSHSSYKQSLI